MSTKRTPKSRPSDTPEAEGAEASGSRALTVNVPAQVLHLAKTRAALTGTTMSAVVTQALTEYAEGLQGVLAKLGLDRPAR